MHCPTQPGGEPLPHTEAQPRTALLNWEAKRAETMPGTKATHGSTRHTEANRRHARRQFVTTREGNSGSDFAGQHVEVTPHIAQPGGQASRDTTRRRGNPKHRPAQRQNTTIRCRAGKHDVAWPDAEAGPYVTRLNGASRGAEAIHHVALHGGNSDLRGGRRTAPAGGAGWRDGGADRGLTGVVPCRPAVAWGYGGLAG